MDKSTDRIPNFTPPNQKQSSHLIATAIELIVELMLLKKGNTD